MILASSGCTSRDVLSSCRLSRRSSSPPLPDRTSGVKPSEGKCSCFSSSSAEPSMEIRAEFHMGSTHCALKSWIWLLIQQWEAPRLSPQGLKGVGGWITAVRICLRLFSGSAPGTPCSCVMDKDGGWGEEGLIPSL